MRSLDHIQDLGIVRNLVENAAYITVNQIPQSGYDPHFDVSLIDLAERWYQNYQDGVELLVHWGIFDDAP